MFWRKPGWPQFFAAMHSSSKTSPVIPRVVSILQPCGKARTSRNWHKLGDVHTCDSFIMYREHIAWIRACWQRAFLEELLRMLKKPPVEMKSPYIPKAVLHSYKGLFDLFVFSLLCMFVLVKSMYLCMTWESYWECTVFAFVAEATVFGFGKNRVQGLVSFAETKFQICKKWTSQPPSLNGNAMIGLLSQWSKSTRFCHLTYKWEMNDVATTDCYPLWTFQCESLFLYQLARRILSFKCHKVFLANKHQRLAENVPAAVLRPVPSGHHCFHMKDPWTVQGILGFGWLRCALICCCQVLIAWRRTYPSTPWITNGISCSNRFFFSALNSCEATR